MDQLSFNLYVETDKKSYAGEDPHCSIYRGKEFIARLYLDPICIEPSNSMTRSEMSAVQSYADYYKRKLIDKFNGSSRFKKN